MERESSPGTGRSRRARWSLPPRRRRDSPGSSPCERREVVRPGHSRRSRRRSSRSADERRAAPLRVLGEAPASSSGRAPGCARGCASSSRKRSRSAVATPDFEASSATFTSSRQSSGAAARASSCVPSTRESSAWISRTRPTMSRTLRLWTWPMKSQVKASSNRACLAIRASVRFSPTSVMPALAERRQVVRPRRTWSPRGSRRPGPTGLSHPGQVRGDDGRRSSTEHPHHSLTAGRPAVAPVREEPLVADRALAGHLDVGHPGGPRAPGRRRASRSARPSRTTSVPKRPCRISATSSPTS